MEKDKKVYDLIIIGAGPAGLSASVYASRYGVKHLILGEILGGQISETHLIDNYLGLEDMSGLAFAEKLGNHAKKYGTEILPKKVASIKKENNLFQLEISGGEVLQARSIFLGTGNKKRKLNLSDEEKFLGKGLSYCATCDGFFYKNKTVAVVGGSDSAAGAAVFLGDIAEKVYIIYRKSALRCEKYWHDIIGKNPKIEVVYNAEILELLGENKLQKIIISQNGTEKKEIYLDGLFIEIGSVPDLEYAKNLNLETDEKGYLKIDAGGKTSCIGVFAGGDITTGSDGFCQVITAASEGAIAARSIFNWLKKGE
jgi:thioredoxin reductase (NADPH)